MVNVYEEILEGQNRILEGQDKIKAQLIKIEELLKRQAQRSLETYTTLDLVSELKIRAQSP